MLIIAILIATPIAYFLNNIWLQNFPYRIEINLGIFIIAGALAVLIGTLTVLYQAIRAARANPIEALHYE